MLQNVIEIIKNANVSVIFSNVAASFKNVPAVAKNVMAVLKSKIAAFKNVCVVETLKNVIEKLKTVSPKTWTRAAFCGFTAISILFGGLLLDEFVVVDGNDIYHITAHAESVKDVINSAGIELSNGDVIVTEGNDGKTVISIDRSYSQTVTSQNKLAADEITESVMQFANVSNSDGYKLPALGGDGTANIKNIGVTHEYETVTKVIKHGYKTVKSREIDKGTTKIKKGSDGEKKVVYKKTLVNGVVISSDMLSQEVVKEPVTQIETVGTRVKFSSDRAVMTSDDVDCISWLKPSKPIELDKNGAPVSYADCITGKASAYWGDKSTATGVASKPGYIAVNPKQIPYGTKMYIVSKDGKYVYGYCIAADTGGFAYNGSGRLVDLRFPNASQGNAFGVRMVNIYILD